MEITALKGVLGCKELHFWTFSPNIYVGTIRIKITRNINEYELLKNIYSRFHKHIKHLTIEFERDEYIELISKENNNK